MILLISNNAKRLLKLRYCRNNENYQDVYPRVAKTLGENEGLEKKFVDLMESNLFLPNSPCLRNAGYSNCLKACFVLPIEDSMESIFSTLNKAALIFKEGGGCGYNFSNIRQKNAPLSKGGTASGVISFLKIYDAITEAVKQGGFRRGASMGILDIDHPEIIDFVTSKVREKVLNNFNLSVLVTDNYMKNVQNNEFSYFRDRTDKRRITNKIKATDLFGLIIHGAWLTGDPGILFKDRINRDNIYYPKEEIEATNPCGEIPLLPYESCCLGSINLDEHIEKDDINFDKFKNTIQIATKFLISMNKYSEYPVDECYKMAAKTNRIGLGLMGFADALIKMSIKYDSEETLKIIDKIGKLMYTEAKKIAYMSASVLSIAPTGSLSILADCSPSIEPIYAPSTEHRSIAGVFSKNYINNEYLRTAHQIEPLYHLKIQAAFQNWIDNSVSKTINLPYDTGLQEIRDIYFKAWKLDLKGITIYRDKCRKTQVLQNCKENECYL